MENTCVCMSAGSASHYLLLQCNMYMDPRITTKEAHSDPFTDYLPHSLSRFHILYHMRRTDKRSCVCLALALMKTATLLTLPDRHFPAPTRRVAAENVTRLNKPLGRNLFDFSKLLSHVRMLPRPWWSEFIRTGRCAYSAVCVPGPGWLVKASLDGKSHGIPQGSQPSLTWEAINKGPGRSTMSCVIWAEETCFIRPPPSFNELPRMAPPRA